MRQFWYFDFNDLEVLSRMGAFSTEIFTAIFHSSNNSIYSRNYAQRVSLLSIFVAFSALSKVSIAVHAIDLLGDNFDASDVQPLLNIMTDLVPMEYYRTFDPANPSETCYAPLYAADSNGDGKVQNSEYALFVADLSDGVFQEETFGDLPFVLKVNFVYLNCLCSASRGTGSNCCKGTDAGISIAGTEPNVIPTQAQMQYLNTVCSSTQASIDYAKAKLPPSTGLPTRKPAQIPLGSSIPTLNSIMTLSPSYDAPVTVIQNPTSSPIPSPSNNIVLNPSMSLAPFTATQSDTPSLLPLINTSSNVPTLKTSVTKTPITSPSSFGSTIPDISSSKSPFSLGDLTQSPSSRYLPSNTPSVINVIGAGQGSVESPATSGQIESLSSGGVAGIIIASIILVLLVGLFALSKKRGRNFAAEDVPSLEVLEKEDDNLESGMTRTMETTDKGGKQDEDDHPNSQRETQDSNFIGTVVISDAVSEGENNTSVNLFGMQVQTNIDEALYSVSPVLGGVQYEMEHESVPNDDSSSSAGASGWSSSAGFSSLNTNSFDMGMDDGLFSPASPGSMLAAIGVASAITHTVIANKPPEDRVKRPTVVSAAGMYLEDNAESISSASDDDDENHTQEQDVVSRKDLDAAIQAGDWAAVSATAALLADTSEHESDPDQLLTSNQSTVSDLDNSRAMELDRLVEVGDWEGVVFAAAQFERNSESDIESNDKSQTLLDDASEPSLLTKWKSNADIRAEVEMLVRRVVPDELDNIDEMMIQFQGREQELIETLRMMHERSVAQRARTAIQKSAKLEAKARSQGAGLASCSRISSHQGAEAISISSAEAPEVNASVTSSVSDFGNSRDPSLSSSKSFLALAVERGDWQAVGEAAAILGAGSSSIIEDDDSEVSDSLVSSLSASKEGASLSMLSSDKEERIQHLDHLIAHGDWAGIVAAAGQYQAIDEEEGHASLKEAELCNEEEQEALAQAEMWQAIARQSKHDSSSETKGAMDAADWAISRSLMKHTAANNTEETDPKFVRLTDDASV